jgi:hypothetical protein
MAVLEVPADFRAASLPASLMVLTREAGEDSRAVALAAEEGEAGSAAVVAGRLQLRVGRQVVAAAAVAGRKVRRVRRELEHFGECNGCFASAPIACDSAFTTGSRIRRWMRARTR